MDESEHQRVEALRPALKREWEILLRAEPTLSPLGNPDVLVYLMDETFNALLASLTQRSLSYWKERSTALRLPLKRHCTCGMNPLLNYYATGEIALHVVVAHELNEHLDAILTCYHVLAQKEIDTLCAVCQHSEARAAAACKTRSPASVGPGEGI